MFVNKTLLAEKGIEFPDSNWEWEDFYRICKKVTDIENHRYGVYGYTWLNAMYSNGAELFSEDHSQCRLVDYNVTAAIRFARSIEMLNQGYVVTAKDFDIGNVAFRPFLYSEYRGYQPYPWRVKVYTGFEWDGIPMPAGPTGGNSSELYTMLLGISARTPHKEAAWEFAKLLSADEEIQQEMMHGSAGISPVVSVAESPETVAFMQENIPGGIVFDKNSIHEIMTSAVVNPYFPKYEQALTMADTAVSELVSTGSVNEDDLLRIQREINQFLKK
jgi:multiple sugar transport system substrate-binding protein